MRRTPEELTFDADGGEKEIRVSSTDGWTLEVEDDWCRPSVTSGDDGDTVTFTVGEYFDPDESRSTVAVFSCGNRTVQVEITQDAKNYSISIRRN